MHPTRRMHAYNASTLLNACNAPIACNERMHRMHPVHGSNALNASIAANASNAYGRALVRRSDAQTMLPVLGTRVGAQNFETPMSHRVPSLLVCALLCSRSHAAMRRGLVRLSVNPWRAAQRIAAQILAVGTSSREAVMREQ